jgi:hypothetical protein
MPTPAEIEEQRQAAARATQQTANDEMSRRLGREPNPNQRFGILEILTNAFPGFDFKILESVTIELSEGAFHKGMADVVRFVGVKLRLIGGNV